MNNVSVWLENIDGEALTYPKTLDPNVLLGLQGAGFALDMRPDMPADRIAVFFCVRHALAKEVRRYEL